MTAISGTDNGSTTASTDAEDALMAAVTRRRVLLAGLAGLASSPVLSALDNVFGATAAAAAPQPVPGVVAGELVRGGHRRFGRPFLTPGQRIRLPQGVEVLSHLDLNDTNAARRPGGAPHPWPKAPARDGSVVDLSVIPKPGAPSQMAYLGGFKDGWYEITDPGGRQTAARVEWDADKLPYLWLWQEWGASTDFPFHGQFYTVGFEPFSSYPAA
jgi:hypothetical protein